MIKNIIGLFAANNPLAMKIKLIAIGVVLLSSISLGGYVTYRWLDTNHKNQTMQAELKQARSDLSGAMKNLEDAQRKIDHLEQVEEIIRQEQNRNARKLSNLELQISQVFIEKNAESNPEIIQQRMNDLYKGILDCAETEIGSIEEADLCSKSLPSM